MHSVLGVPRSLYTDLLLFAVYVMLYFLGCFLLDQSQAWWRRRKQRVPHA